MKSANPHGRLFVISGPSGVGKGCIVQEILRQNQNFALSISYSSRTPRNGEIEGKDYYFVSREEFLAMAKAGKFLEYAEVHGNYYGTAKDKIEKILASGKNLIFEVDIQGGISLKKLMPEIKTIFILPPSTKELIRRIEKRGSETQETLQKRLQTMEKEMLFAGKYDYQIINDNLADTVKKVLELMTK